MMILQDLWWMDYLVPGLLLLVALPLSLSMRSLSISGKADSAKMTRYEPKPVENMRQGISRKFIADKKESVMNHFYTDYMNEALRRYYADCANKPENRLTYFRILAHEIRELYQLAFFIGDRGSVEALKPALKSLTLGNVPEPLLAKAVQRYVIPSSVGGC